MPEADHRPQPVRVTDVVRRHVGLAAGDVVVDPVEQHVHAGVLRVLPQRLIGHLMVSLLSHRGAEDAVLEGVLPAELTAREDRQREHLARADLPPRAPARPPRAPLRRRHRRPGRGQLRPRPWCHTPAAMLIDRQQVRLCRAEPLRPDGRGERGTERPVGRDRHQRVALEADREARALQHAHLIVLIGDPHPAEGAVEVRAHHIALDADPLAALHRPLRRVERVLRTSRGDGEALAVLPHILHRHAEAAGMPLEDHGVRQRPLRRFRIREFADAGIIEADAIGAAADEHDDLHAAHVCTRRAEDRGVLLPVTGALAGAQRDRLHPPGMPLRRTHQPPPGLGEPVQVHIEVAFTGLTPRRHAELVVGVRLERNEVLDDDFVGARFGEVVDRTVPRSLVGSLGYDLRCRRPALTAGLEAPVDHEVLADDPRLLTDRGRDGARQEQGEREERCWAQKCQHHSASNRE